MRRFSKFVATCLLLLAVPLSAQERADAPEPAPREQIALMGTIPLYWGEADGFSDILSGAAQPHWARAVLERYAEPMPLDYLSQEALEPFTFLIMAQPRGLTPEENVALDAWVREGGQLLLFADPLMTGETRFPFGDRRRPQDVALLSPILGHWGLELQFDPDQPDGPRDAEFAGRIVPVNMRGRFALREAAGGCDVIAEALVARCQIGSGQALLVADAAMLDFAGPWPHAESALEAILAHIFPQIGDDTGMEESAHESVRNSDGDAHSHAH